MKKYRVTEYHKVSYTFLVEAESEEEAIALAEYMSDYRENMKGILSTEVEEA